MDNVTIENNSKDGINIEYSSSASIQNSFIKANDDGIEVHRGSSVSLKDSEISQNQDDGITLYENSNMKIETSIVSYLTILPSDHDTLVAGFKN